MWQKIKRKCLAALLVIVVIMQEPSLLRAGKLNWGNACAVKEMISGQDTGSDNTVSVCYYLNGGVLEGSSGKTYGQEELPVEFGVPAREGYNFAGWYTESSFTHKVSRLETVHAGEYKLYAKWTRKIDGDYNVQMYPYQNAAVSEGSEKKLKNCDYRFLEQVRIPGMPGTREEDAKENRITETSQYPQGICITDEYLLVSAYSGEKGGGLGCIHVFDRKTGTYCATIGTKKNSHMGGLAFDGKRIWVCHSGSGTLGCIPYSYVRQVASRMPQSVVDCSASFEEYNVSNTPSCIAFYDGMIWVATHTKLFCSRMAAYQMTERGLKQVKSCRIPDKVQGIVFDEEGRVYVSTSFGRKKSSYLKVYESCSKMDEHPNRPMVKIEMPPCSEEIVLDDQKIYVLFESAAEKYLEGTDGKGKSLAPIDKILAVSRESVFP